MTPSALFKSFNYFVGPTIAGGFASSPTPIDQNLVNLANGVMPRLWFKNASKSIGFEDSRQLLASFGASRSQICAQPSAAA